MPVSTLCLSAFLIAPPIAPLPDDGYDFLVLDMPHRAVMGGALQFAVRGRPGNPYVVFGDIGNRAARFRRLPLHLDLSPALFVAAMGTLPAHGSGAHALGLPNVPSADGLVLYFQAFGTDAGVYDGWTASDGKAVTFHKELNQPLISLLTVNRIPRDQNGAEPGEGTLAVPVTGFTVDLFFDGRSQGAIDPQSLVVTADQPLGGGAVPPGTNLAPFFSFALDRASAVVGPSWAFPAGGIVKLTADVKNAGGASAPQETYTVRSFVHSDFARPFATKQIWWIDFDAHDLDRTGVPDYREDLVLFGLGNSASDRTGPSARIELRARERVLEKMRKHFALGTPEAINIDFSIVRPGGTHSRICVGGRNGYPRSQLPPGAQETTGAAFVDPQNQTKTEVNCFGFVGVHPRSIYWLFKDVPAFQTVFGPLQSNPVGNDPDDPVVTDPAFDPTRGTASQRARWVTIEGGIEAFANAVSFILVQETCHSMGLVEPGILNGGLLGGYGYGHSTDYHFDDGLGNFMSGNNSTPAPAQPANLAMIWGHFQSGRAHFTPLNLAYLQERVVNR
jgi:hypothetical protein